VLTQYTAEIQFKTSKWPSCQVQVERKRKKKNW